MRRTSQPTRAHDPEVDVTFKIIVALFVLWRIVRYLRRRAGRRALSARKHWALLLAHPYVDATAFSGFSFAATNHLGDGTRTFLRAQMLHQMELRTDATDDEARAHLARVLETQWFRADLHALQPTDDPRAALAFACVRMAFFARVAMLMGWADPDSAWRVLLLNAQRAQDCFDGWDDFGRAFIAGRRQWVAGFRADPFGKAFDDAALRRWLTPPDGAWGGAAWPGPAAFSPEPVAQAT
ncbi:hypothetical protein WM21_06705 [Burkholderia ubonensis]|nr:hypothetical protein WM21_06705 [Burkholderia ubonensis]